MRQRIGSLFFAIVFAIVGIVVSNWLIFAWSEGKFTSWEAAYLPEEASASHFVVALGPVVYVESDDGTLFAHPISFDKPPWEEIPRSFLEKVPFASGEDGDCQLTSEGWGGYRKPPGVVRERLECTIYGYEGISDDFRYVILEDGGVWRWEHVGLGWGGLLVLFLMLIITPVSAVVFGWLGRWLFRFLLRVFSRGVGDDEVDEKFDLPPLSQVRRPAQPFQPRYCPQCGSEITRDKITPCLQCGYQPPAADEFLPGPQQGEFRYCERCGQEVGPQLLDCPERLLEECPFKRSESYALKSTQDRILGWAMLLFVTVFLVRGLFTWDDSDILYALACAFGLLFALWSVFSKRQTLHNPATGVFWERRSIFGRETSRKLLTGPEILELDMALPRSFQDPLSIVALCKRANLPGPRPGSINLAIRVFENVLIGLWAREWIKVRRTTTYHSSFGLRSSQSYAYSLFPAKTRDMTPLDGFLERRILKVVYEVQHDDAPEGITVEELVREIYPKDERKPSRWLIQGVEKDAIKRGVCVSPGRGPFRRFELEPAHASRIKEQVQLLQVLHEQATQSHPELIKAFQKKIRLGVSRKPGAFS